MTDDISVFSEPHIKEAVQDLRDLLSQHRVAFLLGAGCSFNAGLPLMMGLTESVVKHEVLSETTKSLLEKLESLYIGAKRPTIEDYMSDAVDYLSVAERRMARGSKDSSVQIGDLQLDPSSLSIALKEIKLAITKIIEDQDPDLTYHQRFIRSIHSSLQAGKPARTIDYFILNYDTLIEDALGIEKIPYTDGFAGAVTGWWEPSVFQDRKVSARVHKIHGSIEWCLVEGDSLPRRIRKGIQIDRGQTAVLIYPAAPKYQEMQRDPFAQLIQNLRSSIRPSEREDVVLAICGYGFQDAHINLEISTALKESGGGLTVTAFTSDSDPEGILKEWFDDSLISPQLRIYTNNKLIHHELNIESDKDLPWWKFEVLARLLGGAK